MSTLPCLTFSLVTKGDVAFYESSKVRLVARRIGPMPMDPTHFLPHSRWLMVDQNRSTGATIPPSLFITHPMAGWTRIINSTLTIAFRPCGGKIPRVNHSGR